MASYIFNEILATGRTSFEDEEIDKERGVILSEKRSRDSVEMRLMEQQFKFLMPDSLITHRFPIGIEKVIESAKRDRFTDYYSGYYIPKNMTFVVVGDIELDDYEDELDRAGHGPARAS